MLLGGTLKQHILAIIYIIMLIVVFLIRQHVVLLFLILQPAGHLLSWFFLIRQQAGHSLLLISQLDPYHDHLGVLHTQMHFHQIYTYHYIHIDNRLDSLFVYIFNVFKQRTLNNAKNSFNIILIVHFNFQFIFLN